MGSGITLKAVDPTDIPTPDTDKSTIFVDSTNSDEPSYKDDTGTVHSLVGAPGPTGPAGPQAIGFVLTEEILVDTPMIPGPKGDTGTGGNDTATYLTEDDETGDLPNSRQLVAGSNITLDDTTPGQLIIASSGGGGGGTNAVGPAFTAPVDGDFAWVNQGGSTIDTTGQGILLTAPAAAGINLRIRIKSAPSTPYVVTAAFYPISGIQSAAGAYYGLVFRESSTQELHCLLVYQSPLGEIISIKFTNPTTFSALYGSAIVQNTLPVPQNKIPFMWLRISDDGTDRKTFYSVDGYVFNQFSSIGRTDFLTADQIGYFVNAQNAGTGCAVRLVSWEET